MRFVSSFVSLSYFRHTTQNMNIIFVNNARKHHIYISKKLLSDVKKGRPAVCGSPFWRTFTAPLPRPFPRE